MILWFILVSAAYLAFKLFDNGLKPHLNPTFMLGNEIKEKVRRKFAS